MNCKNHAEASASARCAGCQEAFCENCLVVLDGNNYCGDCKVMAVRETPIIRDESKEEPCEEATKALKYALIGLFCFGFILGPMAIMSAVEAKKRFKEEPNLTGEGKATAAIIIGAIDFVFWLLGLILRFSNGF